MFRKMACLVSFVLMLGLVADAGAAVLRWNGSADIFCGTPENWLQDNSLTDEWYAVD